VFAARYHLNHYINFRLIKIFERLVEKLNTEFHVIFTVHFCTIDQLTSTIAPKQILSLISWGNLLIKKSMTELVLVQLLV
jgi:hypothetical protein